MKTEVQPVNDKNINSCDWLEESIYIADIAKIAEGHGQTRRRVTPWRALAHFSQPFSPGTRSQIFFRERQGIASAARSSCDVCI